MVMADLPVVSVWTFASTEWHKVGELGAFESLNVTPKHLDAGSWDLTMPYDAAALLVQTDRLLTFDWRGKRLMTGLVATHNPHSDEQTGLPVLDVSGIDTLTMLGWALLWPNPGGTLTQQTSPKIYSGVAEQVIRSLVADNLRDRYGALVTVPVSLGRGSTVTARIDGFAAGLELIAKKAKRGGLGVTLGLVNTTGSRANLTLGFYQPADLSRQVRLSQKVGNLRTWSQTDTAPTATKAIVGGAGTGLDRIFRSVITAESVAAAAAWGGHREVFVDGPGSFDNTELDQAGEEALDSGAATTNLALTAAEASGLLAFRDYNVGDQATAQLLDGADVVDVISSVQVQVGDQGVDVTPTFGNPDANKPELAFGQLLRAIGIQVAQIERRR